MRTMHNIFKLRANASSMFYFMPQQLHLQDLFVEMQLLVHTK